MPRPKSTTTTIKTPVKKASSAKAKVKKASVAKTATRSPKTTKAKSPVKATKTDSPKAKKTGTTKTLPNKGKVTAKEIAKKIDKNIEPHALNDEVTEKVRELIHLSREQGYLTYKNIDQSLPEIANQPEELQNVISIFNNLEIKLLDSNEVDKFKKKKENEKKGKTTR